MTPDQQQTVEDAVRAILVAIGEDPNRPGIADTPKRVAKFWREFTTYEPGNTDTTFEAVHTDQMVTVGPLRVWSLCEHHLLPFWCDIHIGYITRDKVIGLSKMARIAHKHAHTLQLQERLVRDIADELGDILGHTDVAVHATGEHSCMVMRGIKTPGLMRSSTTGGVFRTKPETRNEFLALVR